MKIYQNEFSMYNDYIDLLYFYGCTASVDYSEQRIIEYVHDEVIKEALRQLEHQATSLTNSGGIEPIFLIDGVLGPDVVVGDAIIIGGYALYVCAIENPPGATLMTNACPLVYIIPYTMGHIPELGSRKRVNECYNTTTDENNNRRFPWDKGYKLVFETTKFNLVEIVDAIIKNLEDSRRSGGGVRNVRAVLASDLAIGSSRYCGVYGDGSDFPLSEMITRLTELWNPGETLHSIKLYREIGGVSSKRGGGGSGGGVATQQRQRRRRRV